MCEVTLIICMYSLPHTRHLQFKTYTYSVTSWVLMVLQQNRLCCTVKLCDQDAACRQATVMTLISYSSLFLSH